MSTFSSDVTIFSGVPLSPNYEHTVYYPDGASLRSALRANFNYYSSAGLSYVRVTDGTVKIDTWNANVIDNYNYIEIKNPGAIYIYGFITAIKYINDNTAEISFDIDFFQTYVTQNYVTFGRCFVERTHVDDDTVGLHTLPEPVETGQPYVRRRNVTNFNSAPNMSIMVTAPYRWDADTQTIHDDMGCYFMNTNVNGSSYPFVAGLYNNMFSLTQDGINNFSIFLNAVAQDYNRLTRIVQASIQPTNYSDTTLSYVKTQSGSLNGHNVRNNKLYVYPYNYFKVDNSHGSEIILKYEDFNGSLCTFRYFNGGNIVSAAATLHPTGYEQSETSGADRTDLSLSLPQFPQIAITGDTFQNWLASQMPSLFTGAGNALLSAGVGSAMGGGAGAAVGAALSVASSLINFAGTATKEASAGRMAIGSQSSLITDMMSGKYEFGFSRMELRPDVYEAIDSFFDVYGYNVSKVMYINRAVRSVHTYIKTTNCTISGNSNCPAEGVGKILKAMNTGITFWNGFGNYGDYGAYNGII